MQPRRILISGAEGSGRRTLFHALGGPMLGQSSPSVFVDAFKRSLGEFRGASADVWIQLAHGGLELERRDRERTLIAQSDAVVFLCDARPERLEATRRAVAQAPDHDRCVFVVSHARSASCEQRMRAALGINSPHWLRLGANDPLGALAVMKLAARASASARPRELVWPTRTASASLFITR